MSLVSTARLPLNFTASTIGRRGVHVACAPAIDAHAKTATNANRCKARRRAG
jgi:hypothetical protein